MSLSIDHKFTEIYNIIREIKKRQMENETMKTGWKERYIADKAFYKRTLQIAIPIMIQYAVTNFVSLLDNIMVGKVGTEQMTGVAIVNQLIFVFNLLVFGVVSAAGIFGAQYCGKGDEKGMRETFRFKFICCVSVAVLGIAFFVLFGGSLCRLYLQGEGNAQEIQASFNYAMRYLYIMLIGLIPFGVSQCFSSTLREMGKTMLPMRASVTAVCVNLSLNAVLIFGLLGAPRMGAAGAAVATVIARYTEATVLIFSIYQRREEFPFLKGAFRSFYVSGTLVKGIILKGIPLMINETLWGAGVAFLNQCYSLRGYEIVSAVNITSTISNLFNVSFIALGNAIGVMVGQRLGAGKKEEAVDESRKLLVFSVAVFILFGAGLAMVAPYFPRIYNTSQEIRQIATHLIWVVAIYLPVAGLSNCYYFTIRSGGKIWVTVLFDSMYVWVVTVPLAYVLSRFTNLPIVFLYFCCQMIEIGKCMIGYFLIKKRVWLNQVV